MPPIVDQGEPMNANGIGARTAARIRTRSRGLAHALAPEHRRERGAEAHEPARERQAVDGLRRLRHLTLADRAVDAGERPEALGDDHDAVRTRHAAETGQREGGVTAAEHGRCRIHTPVVSDKWAAPRGRDGPSFDAVESYEPGYQTLREKKPSNARTRTTIRMIQRIPMCEFPPFRRDQRSSGDGRYGQQALDRRLDAEAVAQLHVLGRARAPHVTPTARGRRAASRSWPCARPRRTRSRRRGSRSTRAQRRAARR